MQLKRPIKRKFKNSYCHINLVSICHKGSEFIWGKNKITLLFYYCAKLWELLIVYICTILRTLMFLCTHFKKNYSKPMNPLLFPWDFLKAWEKSAFSGEKLKRKCSVTKKKTKKTMSSINFIWYKVVYMFKTT